MTVFVPDADGVSTPALLMVASLLLTLQVPPLAVVV
jgi:hypothetical protein